MTNEEKKEMKPVKRDSHPFHIWDSVQQIPDLLSTCLEADVTNQIKKITHEILQRKIEKFIFLGRGSSYFLSLSLKYLFDELTNFQVSCFVTNGFESYLPITLDAHTAVFFHSTSGNSEGDKNVVELAKKHGAYTVGVTDIPTSILAQAVDDVLIGPGGAKFESPATRTYSTAMFRMSLLAIEIARMQGNSKKAEALMENLKMFPKMLGKFIPEFEKTSGAAAKIINSCSAYFVTGYGPNIATADESALALSQCTGVLGTSYDVENFIHGGIQALTKSMGVVVIANDGPLQARSLSAAMACKTIGAKTIVLVPEGLGKLPYADVQISLPDGINDLLSPIIYMVPMWQLGYQLALFGKGGHPDRLRMDQPEFTQAFKFLMSNDKWVSKV